MAAFEWLSIDSVDWCSSSLFQQRLPAEENQPNPELRDSLLTDSNISMSSFHILKLRDHMSFSIKDKQAGILPGSETGGDLADQVFLKHIKRQNQHTVNMSIYTWNKL